MSSVYLMLEMNRVVLYKKILHKMLPHQDVTDGNQLTSRGQTTVQPTTIGSPDVTHITGAIPATDENSILSGTRKFQDATGQVRLSGSVNLDNLGSGEITFDCLFVINLDRS